MKIVMLEIKCEGNSKDLIKYLEEEVIPDLKRGSERGYETWCKGWVLNNHETILGAEVSA